MEAIIQQKILVVGKTGQLARALAALAESRKELDVLCIGRPEVDLCDNDSLCRIFAEFGPDFVVNAAAYTAVDLAESNEEKAFQVNALGVKNLADCCLHHGAQLIHVSTDYVFDGTKSAPLCVEETVAPLGAYGRSKLAGEWAVRSILSDALVIRTSWVYGDEGSNFVSTMLRLGQERDVLKIVADQFGRPTYASDLAAAIFQIIEQLSVRESSSKGGIYHYSNEGEVISWHQFAVAIFEQAKQMGLKVPTQVDGIPSEEYPTPVERPKWSVLDVSKIKATFQLDIPDWSVSLQTYFAGKYPNENPKS